MTFLPLHSDFYTSLKPIRLANELKISLLEARGVIVSIWTWALEHASDGDITKYSAKDLSFVVGVGDEKNILDALVSVGLVDKIDDDGRTRFELHDWLENIERDKSLIRREYFKEKKTASRMSKTNFDMSKNVKDMSWTKSPKRKEKEIKGNKKKETKTTKQEIKESQEKSAYALSVDAAPLVDNAREKQTPLEGKKSKPVDRKTSISKADTEAVEKIIEAWNRGVSGRVAKASRPSGSTVKRDVALRSTISLYPDPTQWEWCARAISESWQATKEDAWDGYSITWLIDRGKNKDISKLDQWMQRGDDYRHGRWIPESKRFDSVQNMGKSGAFTFRSTQLIAESIRQFADEKQKQTSEKIIDVKNEDTDEGSSTSPNVFAPFKLETSQSVRGVLYA